MTNITQTNQKTQDLPEAQTAMQIISEGRDRAQQLMDLVTQNQWAKNIQGKNFLQVEAWQTLGRFYGYTAITRETKYIEYNGVKGFDARVEILDKDGRVIGGAEASCMTDEQNWRGKPLYSVKSMAQTRALGKAYRQILSFVAVMGGYEPTPAEEMDGVEIKAEIVRPATNYPPRETSSASWKSEPATWSQIVKIQKSINYVETLGRGSHSQIFVKYGVKVEGTKNLTPENITKGQASSIINEIDSLMVNRNS